METLQQYYEWIEQVNVHAHHHVSSAIKKLQDELTEQQEKDSLTFEMFAMDFMLEDGDLKPIYQTTSKEGDESIFEYPNRQDLTLEAANYLLSRAEITGNHSAKARYAQVVANTDHKQLSGKAIKLLTDGYIGFINELLDKPFEKGSRCYMIRSAMQNVYPFAIKSKYRFEKINTLLKSIVINRSALSGTFRVSMIEFLFTQRNHFLKSDLIDCLDICENMYVTGDAEELRVMEELWEIATKLVRSVGGDLILWHSRMGLGYEKEIDRENDTVGMAGMENCQHAIEKYRLAKNFDKVKELSKRYTELRKNLKFSKIETNLNVTELNKHFNHFKAKFKKHITEMTPFEVINFVVNETKLYPEVSLLKKRIQNQKPSFMDYVSLFKADSNKNFQKKITEKEDHALNKLYETYHFDMQIYILQQMRLMFYYGYTHDKINYQTVIHHLQNHSWIGKNLMLRNSAGELVTYNWISVIAPALYELFSSFQVIFRKANTNLPLVLPLDSLTLKFEGLLRDLARMSGADTILNAKDVVREMYIEELLETSEIKALFSEDDIMYFKYVFVSKFGLNLRNQIAHSFLRTNDYTMDKSLLVLVGILRLGRYSINTDSPVL